MRRHWNSTHFGDGRAKIFVKASQTKRQIPTSKLQRSSNHQAKRHRRIEDWSFKFLWMLELGIWSFSSPARHHFEQDAFEIFCFWQSGQHRMIRRLLKAAKPAR